MNVTIATHNFLNATHHLVMPGGVARHADQL